MTSRRSDYITTPSQQKDIKFSLSILKGATRSMVSCIRVLLALGLIGLCAASSSRYQPQKPSYPQPQQPSYQQPQTGYQQQSHGYEQKSYQKAKYCYQCAYSPPKTYYDKKVVLEKHQYGGYEKQQEQQGYGSSSNGYGQSGHGYHGGYAKKTYVPVPRTINGGWDKCLGPFDHYTAKEYGVDVWDCHSNCYVRKDPNGDIFRGCYKGEYGVNPHKTGCNQQGGHGSVYCFCEGDKCNNGPAPH